MKIVIQKSQKHVMSSTFLAISASCLCFNLSLIEAKVGSILTGPGSAEKDDKKIFIVKIVFAHK